MWLVWIKPNVTRKAGPAPPQMERSEDHLIKRSNPESGPCTLLGQDSSVDPGGGSAGELDSGCENRTGLAPCCLLATLGELDRKVLESLPGRRWWGKGGRLTNPATTGAQNQDKTAHTNIQFNYKLSEDVKGMNLQIQSYRISITEDSNRMAKYWGCNRSQRMGTRPISQCYKHLQVKLYRLKGLLQDSLDHPTVSMPRCCYCCCCCWFVLFSVLLLNFVEWSREGVTRAKGSHEGMWGNEWGWDA